MAGHAFWDDDDPVDLEVCSRVIRHGHGYVERCPGMAMIWYRLGELTVSRCLAHAIMGCADMAQISRIVTFEEAVAAWVMET